MYAYQEYPKWVYKGDNGKIVQDADEHEAATADGWGAHGSKTAKTDKPKRTSRTKEQIEADKAAETAKSEDAPIGDGIETPPEAE